MIKGRQKSGNSPCYSHFRGFRLIKRGGLCLL